MKGMGSIHRINQTSLPAQPIELPTLHVNMGESGVIGTREEVEQYLNQIHAKQYCVVPLSSSPERLQILIAALQELQKQIDSNPKNYLLPSKEGEVQVVQGQSGTESYLRPVGEEKLPKSQGQISSEREDFLRPLEEEETHGLRIDDLYSGGHKDKVVEYINHYFKDIDLNEDEGLILMRAAQQDDVATLKLLLNEKVEIEWVFDAFAQAAQRGKQESTRLLMDYLIGKGQDISKIRKFTAYNNYGYIKEMIDEELAKKTQNSATDPHYLPIGV
jgi:hypothetical protein